MGELRAYLEFGVGAHVDDAVVAWVFDLDLWGVCGQGTSGASALDALARAASDVRGTVPLRVVERIHGDEQAFARDHRPAADSQRARTLEILAQARQQTLALIAACPDPVLDWDDPGRVLPPWASWRTLRGMAWHVADTESRYYLPGLGLPTRPREDDLLEELRRSGEQVRAVVATVAPGLVREAPGQVWTTTKLLRRLAWHERSELRTMRQLAERAHQQLGRLINAHSDVTLKAITYNHELERPSTSVQDPTGMTR
jgi:hypothetical protein